MGGGMSGEKPFEKIDPVKEPAKEPKRWELSKDGLELIKEFEGCSLKSYQDAVGVWTIGYGKIVYADGSRVHGGFWKMLKKKALILFVCGLPSRTKINSMRFVHLLLIGALEGFGSYWPHKIF